MAQAIVPSLHSVSLAAQSDAQRCVSAAPEASPQSGPRYATHTHDTDSCSMCKALHDGRLYSADVPSPRPILLQVCGILQDELPEVPHVTVVGPKLARGPPAGC
ncbi:MAG: hypothetical protein IPJ41_03510 [Phycisphaerales bacterium]|nr:hypothetical protein [Phycisphaerales bacterium]